MEHTTQVPQEDQVIYWRTLARKRLEEIDRLSQLVLKLQKELGQAEAAVQQLQVELNRS